MNKTAKRAAEKHRANKKRFTLRRKADAGLQGTASKAKAPAASTTRARSSRSGAEADNS